MGENEIAKVIVDAAIEVHRTLGEQRVRQGIHRVVNGLQDDP